MRHKDTAKSIQGKMTMIRKICMSKFQGQTQEPKVSQKKLRSQNRSLIWTVGLNHILKEEGSVFFYTSRFNQISNPDKQPSPKEHLSKISSDLIHFKQLL